MFIGHIARSRPGFRPLRNPTRTTLRGLIKYYAFFARFVKARKWPNTSLKIVQKSRPLIDMLKTVRYRKTRKKLYPTILSISHQMRLEVPKKQGSKSKSSPKSIDFTNIGMSLIGRHLKKWEILHYGYAPDEYPKKKCGMLNSPQRSFLICFI